MTQKQKIKGGILIARTVTEEPDVLEGDLQRIDVQESMAKYAEDWIWLLPAWQWYNKHTRKKITVYISAEFHLAIDNDAPEYGFKKFIELIKKHNQKI